jgi:hypothetical protein
MLIFQLFDYHDMPSHTAMLIPFLQRLDLVSAAFEFLLSN